MTWIDQLVDQELLQRDPEYRVLEVTERGWQILHGQTDASLRDFNIDPPTGPRRRRSRGKRKTPAAELSGIDSPDIEPNEDNYLDSAALQLFERLRALRRRIADERNVPAFMVFSDKALRGIARARPKNRAEMLAVKGVGPVKYERFGERFVEVVRSDSSTQD
jgi:ATP-dependent DNA helicase RecQ